MGEGKPNPSSEVAQLIARGMHRQGIPSLRKLEEICEVSSGYFQHLAEGDIRNPKEQTLRRLAHVLGQRVEEYRAALLADHQELPAPVYYFSARLGVPVDPEAAELGMKVVEELTRRKSQDEN